MNGYLLCVLLCVAMLLATFTRRSRARRADFRQTLRTRLVQVRVNCGNAPLLYTIDAAAQRARHSISLELVETAFAYPDASGKVQRSEIAWFERDFGSRRLKMWAAEGPAHRPPIVTRLEVAPLSDCQTRMSALGRVVGRIRTRSTPPLNSIRTR